MPVFGAKMLEPPVTAGDYIKIIVAIFTMIEITSAKGLCDAWYQIIGGNLLKDVQFRGNTSDISWIAAGTESRIDFRLSLEWHNDYSKEGSPLYLSLQQNLTKFMIGAKQALGYDNFQFTVHSFSPGSVIAHTSFKPKIRNTEDLRQRRDRLRQNNNLRVKRGSAEFGMLYEMRISRYTSGDTNKNPITWAILTCKANVSDNRRTTWSKGGSPIVSDGNRIQIRRIEKENTVTSTLRINPMIYSDAGQYRCTIGNFKSQRKVTMLPKVKLESSVKPKIFEGVRFEMTCTVVVGDGTVRVRFLHDQNLLKQTSTSGNQATHVVEQAGLGTYCCVGVSTGGKLGPKSTKLTVFERYYQSFSVLLVNKVDVIVTYRKMESLSTRDFSHYEIIAETTGEMPLKFFTQAPFGELTIRNLTADKGYTIKMRPITTNSAIVKSTSKTVHTRGIME
ncbi:uncharacterized protein LOC141905517 [Tubulanus polymorphus]|uniref:uncharacterized protein LOC141905517 n=1 Tax=Tubulanus polymorphus TaxID=672921 RepID=UPI003DA61992